MRWLGLVMAACVLAMAAVPAGARQAARTDDGPPAEWRRVDMHTLRRTDIAVAAAQWQRVDVQRWRLMDGPVPRAVAMTGR